MRCIDFGSYLVGCLEALFAHCDVSHRCELLWALVRLRRYGRCRCKLKRSKSCGDRGVMHVVECSKDGTTEL